MDKSKSIACSVHGYITVSSLAISIIDTREFQRLRRIKQLGVVSFVYPCATHTRFEHSLGVYHLTGKLLENIKKKYPRIKFNNQYLGDNILLDSNIIELIKLGGLVHDIGHGMYSHLFDDILLKDSTHENKTHEKRSELLTDIILRRNTKLEDKYINFVKSIISPKKEDKGFIYQIVCNHTSSGIDVDKFDYISRDTKTLGLDLGFNYQRLITDIIIDEKNNICYPKQLAFHITQLFHTRYALHKMVYNHKNVKLIEHYIVEMMKLMNPFCNFDESIQDMNKFIEITDETLFQMIHFYKNPPPFISISYNNKTDSESSIKEFEKSIKKACNYLDLLERRKFYTFIDEVLFNLSIEKFTEIDKEIDNTIIHLINYKIGFSSGKKNPLDHIYLYDKAKEQSFLLDRNSVSSLLPVSHFENITLIFCKHPSKVDKVKEILNKIKEKYT